MATAHWCRIDIDGKPRLGRLEGEKIALYEGGLFADPVADGTVVDRHLGALSADQLRDKIEDLYDITT